MPVPHPVFLLSCPPLRVQRLWYGVDTLGLGPKAYSPENQNRLNWPAFWAVISSTVVCIPVVRFIRGHVSIVSDHALSLCMCALV